MKLWWIMLGGLGAVAIFGAVTAYSAARSDYDFLEASLQPKVLDRAVWCWQDEAARARTAASSSHRDGFVVETAVLGAAASSGNNADSSSVTRMTNLNRHAYRLGFLYGFFWPPAERKKLFDYVAASRPVCSSTFGPDAKAAPIIR
jgi:hypothetical protein